MRAIDALRHRQRQLDLDGCEVGVSRQALDEVLAEHERLRALIAEEADRHGSECGCEWCELVNDCRRTAKEPA